MKKRIISGALSLALILAMLLTSALAAGCPVCVDFNLGGKGVSADLTSTSVASDSKVTEIPTVVPLDGRVFLGWSLTDPATLKEGQTATLVDLSTYRVQADTVFYAVYNEAAIGHHTNYVIGYPNGTFGPSDFITRGSVATIIARAVLEGFEEGADYGNPGNFNDVKGHWAESAIAYCAKFGVMVGMDGNRFGPDAFITREQLALTLARLLGVEENKGLDFPDADKTSKWAIDGMYTAVKAGLLEGDNAGMLRPGANISRAETVTVFNRFLKRGVDAEGLSDLKEYVHSGVASNNTENGTDEYMTWPDVPKSHWGYYAIIEAANDHEYHYTGADGKSLPEKWTKCWIDERWRYHDNSKDGGVKS